MNEEMQTGLSTDGDEFGFLDLLVTLAENLKLLVIGSLLVGLCALAISFALPQTYESVAVIQAERSADPQGAPVGLNAAAVASLMTTASVLDPVAVTLGLVANNDLEDARRKLREQIKTTVGRGDKLLTLTVSATISQQAQALASAVLQQTYLQSRPKAGDLARLEAQLTASRTRAENAQNTASRLAMRLESPGSGNDLARSYADLLTVAAAAQAQTARLEAEMQGLSEAQLVQAPTLPRKAVKPKKGLIAIGATLAAGLALLLFVFIRQALRSNAENTESAEKLARIRRSLSLK